MKLVLVVLCYFFKTAFSIKQYREVSAVKPLTCITPNNDLGVCVEVRKCQIFIDAIRSRRENCYGFIRESQCGSLNQNAQHPKVCCGMYANYLDQIITTTTATAKNVPKKKKSMVCGSGGIGDRIVGGDEASLGEFPWMARLRHLRSDGLLTYGCAGFLISEKFVLTAAHCIYSKTLESLGPIYQVQLGEHNTEVDQDCSGHPQICSDSPQLLRTAQPIVHPNYSNDSQHHNDIAVIPLEEPAKLTHDVGLICLPKTPSNGIELWVSGWGKTETGQNSPAKLKVMVPRADWAQCSALYRTRGLRVLGSQFCAGGEAGRDSCTGDSGGPIMAVRNGVWYAEGIVSVGKGCGEKGWPAVYTNLHYYTPWIEMVMSQHLEKHEEGAGNGQVDGNQTEKPIIWNK